MENSTIHARLVVPPGALDHTVALTIERAVGVPTGSLKAIEIGPSGTKFSVAATVAISYDGVSLGDTKTENLRVATVSNGTWVELDGPTVDDVKKEVSGTTTHLSPFALIGIDPEPPPMQPPACTTLNMCADGCPCGAMFIGATCQRGTEGMAECTKCSCDGSKFSCKSCSDAGAGGTGGAGGSGGASGSAGAGGAPMTCNATEHCDTTAVDSMCIEYGAYPAGDVKKFCSGTYGTGRCPSANLVGGCVKSFAGQCDARRYYSPMNTAAADVQGICTSLQRSFEAP